MSDCLKQAEPLTWNDIYNALRSKCLNETRLADRIRKKYGHLFISDPCTETESEQDHEIQIRRVIKRDSKKQKGVDHQARVSKERERSSYYEGIETVRSGKHVQEAESEDQEYVVLSRKENKGRRNGGKPAHNKGKQAHDKVRPTRMNTIEKIHKR